MAITEQAVLDRLRTIGAPGGGDIVGKGLVQGVFITGSKVFFSLAVTGGNAAAMEPVRAAAATAVSALEGVEKVTATLTAETRAAAQPAPARPAQPARPQPPAKAGIPGIRHIIAVASGKGGVGKSTTAVNIALGLAAEGLSVGVLDADIYGPSVPRLLGIRGKPELLEGKRLKPMEAFGLKVMSMGFLVDEEAPMIWRGPMVVSALTQMLREVAWGALDVLVVDMPPGTGDIALTMAQQVPLTGAVIVSTPQDLALIDARKGINMFRKVEVPVLGLVENMSFFVCPDCGGRHDIFGHGGAREEARRIGADFLGEVPLHMVIRTSSDDGAPVVATDPGGPQAAAYRAAAAQVAARLASADGRGTGPSIVFE
ncbi:MAG: Mrp/NBP35 family ATP-binding protein [Notoacmeibacter sp.]|nr:Mrp/NBP35 family ATP-binding protein [Notoacmeibacter sp.]